LYYIAPQVWAWGKGRVKKMAKIIDKMAVIFQFEKDIFADAGIDTVFVGHPLLEVLQAESNREEFFKKNNLDEQRPLVALLPGSRPQEVRTLLPEMLRTAQRILQDLPEIQFVAAKAASIAAEDYEHILGDSHICRLVERDTYSAMSYADAAIVASGTATLETACFATPFVIGYRVKWLSYQLMKRLITIPYIGLVNVVAGNKIIDEFIQNDFKAENVAPAIIQLLQNDKVRRQIIDNLRSVKQKLGKAGASECAAEAALEMQK